MNNIQTIGIIGAGTMGNGIAQACATSGLNVVMVDINEAAVQKGVATVAGSLDRLIKKEKLTAAEKDAALARIKGSTSYDDLKGAQLVIEAAREHGGRNLVKQAFHWDGSAVDIQVKAGSEIGAIQLSNGAK